MRRHNGISLALLLLAGIVLSMPRAGALSMDYVAQPRTETLGGHPITIVADRVPRFDFVLDDRASVPRHAEFALNSTRVILKNERLIVNGLDYGELKNGDAVNVRFDVVSVGTEERKGKPLTPEARKELFPANAISRIKDKIGEFPLTITLNDATRIISFRNDSEPQSRIGFLNNDITAEATELSVRSADNYLFVNGDGHGFLSKTDTIECVDGKVFVSGKQRSAGDIGYTPSIKALVRDVEKLVGKYLPGAIFIDGADSNGMDGIRFDLPKPASKKTEDSSKARDHYFVRGRVGISHGRGLKENEEIRRSGDDIHRYASLTVNSSEYKCHLTAGLYSQQELPKGFEKEFFDLVRHFEAYIGRD